MAEEILMFFLPRDGEPNFRLDAENDFKDASYMTNYPVYDGELSLENFARAEFKSVKMEELIRLLIQKHLNKLSQ